MSTAERRVNMLSNGVYLESLFDLFYEHVAICSETVHGEHSAVGPKGGVNGTTPFFFKENWTDNRKTLEA